MILATLDGEAIEPGGIDLWGLELGEHVLEVTVVNTAGLESTAVVEFTIEPTTADLRANIERLTAEGAISPAESAQLGGYIGQAERHLAAERTQQAMKALERIADATDDALLQRDVAGIIASLG